MSTKPFLIVSFFVVMVALGCGANRQFVKAVDGYTRIILPEYKEYVQRDTTIAEDTKRIRIQSAEQFQALVDDAKEMK